MKKESKFKLNQVVLAALPAEGEEGVRRHAGRRGPRPLVLRDQLRIEAGLPVARDLQLQLAGVGHD